MREEDLQELEDLLEMFMLERGRDAVDDLVERVCRPLADEVDELAGEIDDGDVLDEEGDDE